jgi:hypothetical protein
MDTLPCRFTFTRGADIVYSERAKMRAREAV